MAKGWIPDFARNDLVGRSSWSDKLTMSEQVTLRSAQDERERWLGLLVAARLRWQVGFPCTEYGPNMVFAAFLFGSSASVFVLH